MVVRYITLLGLVVFLSACTHLNEGQNEYRVVAAGAQDWHMYVDKHVSTAAHIKVGQNISLHLMHGFIKGFNEWITDMPNTVRGEIAIIANVFEVGKNNTVMDFANGNEKRNGRLIYYSDDVRQNGHHLNFSYLPIYGPIHYKGGPLAIQFTILELDQFEGSRAKTMINTLATLGRKAYAPSSDVLKFLDTLGESLLAGGGDDREFKFTFFLQPPLGHHDTLYPVLLAGNYAMVKQEPYTETSDSNEDYTEWKFKKTKWDNLVFNDGNGQLYESAKKNCFNEKREFTLNNLALFEKDSKLIGQAVEACKNTTASCKKVLLKEKRVMIEAGTRFKRLVEKCKNNNLICNKIILDFLAESPRCPDFSQPYEKSTYLTFQINSGFKGHILNAAETYSTFLKKMDTYEQSEGLTAQWEKLSKSIASSYLEEESVSIAENIKENCVVSVDVSKCKIAKNKLYLTLVNAFDADGKLTLSDSRKDRIAKVLVDVGGNPVAVLDFMKDKSGENTLPENLKEAFDAVFATNGVSENNE